jgi:hypothetical protein
MSIPELEALDRVLAGASLEPRDAAIAEVVAAVREGAPQMDPAFRERLDARISARRPGRLLTGRRLAFAGGGLALATAGAVALVVLAGGRGAVRTAEPLGGPPVVAQSSSGATAAPGAGAAPAIAQAPAVRQVQRDASLSLTVPHGHIQDVADRVVQTTERLGGVVQSSSVSAGDQAPGQASFTLRLPAAQLDQALATLSALGHVSALTQNAQDITAPVNSARGRLAQAQAQRRSLLGQLARATTANQAAAIRAQLALVAGQISAAQRSLSALQRSAGYATVQLTLAESTSSAAGGGGAWTPADALRDALAMLETVFGVLVVASSVLVAPAVLMALAAWLGAGARRRRREQALGPV